MIKPRTISRGLDAGENGDLEYQASLRSCLVSVHCGTLLVWKPRRRGRTGPQTEIGRDRFVHCRARTIWNPSYPRTDLSSVLSSHRETPGKTLVVLEALRWCGLHGYRSRVLSQRDIQKPGGVCGQTLWVVYCKYT